MPKSEKSIPSPSPQPWMACGLDTQHHLLYRQSQIPQVCELSWYLSCYTPYPMLANAHGFKAQINNLSQVSAGLFSYPVLMAADILLYQATEVPVGPDQAQHLEITRDIGSSFNHKHGPVFNLPVAAISSSEKAEIPRHRWAKNEQIAGQHPRHFPSPRSSSPTSHAHSH